MNDSVRWLRLYLGLAGAMAFLNIMMVAQAKGAQDVPAYVLPLTLAFATLSVFCGVLMFFAAWRCEQLVAKAPGFIRAVLVLRFLIVAVEQLPPALSGNYLNVSLLLFWTGITFFMLKMTGRLAEAAKPAAR